MTAWKIDAYNYFHGPDTERDLLLNANIREFLQLDSSKMILVGGKGFGKTLFLRYKSYLFHQSSEGMKTNTSQKQLTENLSISPRSLSKEELLQFVRISHWRTVWQLALWIMAYRIYGIAVNPEVEKIVGTSKRLSPILTALLNNRKDLYKLKDFLSDFQNNVIDVKSSVVIFIDDIDQTLHQFLEEHHYSDDFFEGQESPAVQVWCNAQMALIETIYAMHRQNAHIKIYATIRREAWEAYEGELKANYKEHISVLNYTHHELEMIFEKNVNQVPKSVLIDPKAKNMMERLLGFSTMQHRFAKDPVTEEPRAEGSFEFLLRHSYGRPREIVSMGAGLTKLVASEEYKVKSKMERVEAVRDLANSESKKFFRQYQREIIPRFDANEFYKFIKKIRTNVFSSSVVKDLDANNLRKFYNFGLVGIVKIGADGKYTQHFEMPSRYNYRRLDALPKSDFFLVHSTLDADMLENHSYGNFYNKYNIIGNGNAFKPTDQPHIESHEYYYPKTVQGNRWLAANASAYHLMPLQVYFEALFSFHEPEYDERFFLDMDVAARVFNLLGRLSYCKILEKKYGAFYAEKEKEIMKSMYDFHFQRQYSSVMRETDAELVFEEDMPKFLDKLFGRIITLGSILYLDLCLHTIHTLFRYRKLQFRRPVEPAKKAFRYLSRSFFIHHLTINEPRDPRNPLHQQRKQRIFEACSDFEKKLLREFRKDSIDEISTGFWFEKEEHKTYLLNQLETTVWNSDH